MSSINQILNNALENTLYETTEFDDLAAKRQQEYNRLTGANPLDKYLPPSTSDGEKEKSLLDKGKDWVAGRPTWEKVAVPSAIGAGLGALILAKRLRAKKKAATKK